jgi:hypothetical protein
MNNTLRNQKNTSNHSEPCKQAFDYDDDVTVEAIKHIRQKAEKAIGTGKWKLVSGNVAAKQ